MKIDVKWGLISIAGGGTRMAIVRHQVCSRSSSYKMAKNGSNFVLGKTRKFCGRERKRRLSRDARQFAEFMRQLVAFAGASGRQQ